MRRVELVWEMVAHEADTQRRCYLPIILSALFLALPIIRSIHLTRLERKRRRRGIEKQVMRLIFNGRWRGTVEEIRMELHRRRSIRVDRRTVEHALMELRRTLGGDMILDEEGSVVYTFERLHRETETAAGYRERRAIDTPA